MNQFASRKSEVLFIYHPENNNSANAITTGVETLLFNNPFTRHLKIRKAKDADQIEHGFIESANRLGLLIFHLANPNPTDALLEQTLKIMEQNNSLAIPLLIGSLLPERMEQILGSYETQPSRITHLQIPIVPTDLTKIIRSQFPH